MTELWIRLAVVVVLLGAATLGWLLLQHRRRPRRVEHGSGLEVIAARVPVPAGAGQVVVQFSGPHCSACGPTARAWRSVTSAPDAFVEVDVTEHLELATAFGVLSTPTSLVFDNVGRLRARVGGAASPTRAREALSLVAAQ
ncbi:thioredoxin family protein [Ruania alkalisoli]|uniref:Thioredoxin family protein n=1 Tax=Ruania alkalisoli TaxID=2779775 RepID=A0A7M1SXZ6_9MICO|nr:thioredoxin family protein [Ruania alkalisoli]QOR72419.1 thioredoxin family protein [Ruania alkalisoli]